MAEPIASLEAAAAASDVTSAAVAPANFRDAADAAAAVDEALASDAVLDAADANDADCESPAEHLLHSGLQSLPVPHPIHSSPWPPYLQRISQPTLNWLHPLRLWKRLPLHSTRL